MVVRNKMEEIDLKDIRNINNRFRDWLDEEDLCKEGFKMRFQGFHLGLSIKEAFVHFVFIPEAEKEYISYKLNDCMLYLGHKISNYIAQTPRNL